MSSQIKPESDNVNIPETFNKYDFKLRFCGAVMAWQYVTCQLSLHLHLGKAEKNNFKTTPVPEIKCKCYVLNL